VGPRPLPFGDRSNDIFTADLSATASWSHYEIGLIATNLFDNHYRLGEYNYVSNFDQGVPASLVPVRHFTPGAPRGLFATLALHFGGGP
jgi:hypothetical protein